MLETIEVETAPIPTRARDLAAWPRAPTGMISSPSCPSWCREARAPGGSFFPNAPVRPVTINGGMRMRAWYDIVGLDRRAVEDVAGFQDSDHKIRELIGREVTRGIPANRIVLAGFSQGGAVSLYNGRRGSRKSWPGVMALSCYLPQQSTFGAEHTPANGRGRRYHGPWPSGRHRPMMLGVKSRDFLLAQGYKVEWHEYPMAHAVCAEEVAGISANFISRIPKCHDNPYCNDETTQGRRRQGLRAGAACRKDKVRSAKAQLKQARKLLKTEKEAAKQARRNWTRRPP